MKKDFLNKIGLFVGGLLTLTILNYFLLIPLNLRYTEVFFIFISLIGLVYITFNKNIIEKKYMKVGPELVETKIPKKEVFYVIGGLITVLLIHGFSSTPLIFSKQYQQLIGEVYEKDFTTEFTIVEKNELPIVDSDYAAKLGDKKLGSERGLGSEYHVGEFSDIVVAGKMYMVAPLEFNGFFKWMNNKSTPGYVKVDKITGEVELVTEINNKKIELKYLSSAYFNNNLKRHAYYNGNMDNALVKTTFELDDEGRPYFIINKTHKTIGINGGDDILSVVVVDAQTGEVKEYKPSDAPEWIDTIYPKEIVLKQIDDWGYYVNGYLNTIFGEKDIVRTTNGSRRVYNENNLYHYTGLTSSGADESTVGFVFINTKTKETTFYKMTGATEYSAMRSAQGKVENFGYKATFPVTINVYDEPTFFITLKDSSGLIKQYAFVNITDFSIVGNGETINSALNSYLKALDKESVPNDTNNIEIEGTIERIGFDISGGETNYYIIIKEDKKLYYASSTISKELNVTKVGDSVKITVNNNRIVKFDNLDI
jgi:hypothetical protein